MGEIDITKIDKDLTKLVEIVDKQSDLILSNESRIEQLELELMESRNRYDELVEVTKRLSETKNELTTSVISDVIKLYLNHDRNIEVAISKYKKIVERCNVELK